MKNPQKDKMIPELGLKALDSVLGIYSLAQRISVTVEDAGKNRYVDHISYETMYKTTMELIPLMSKLNEKYDLLKLVLAYKSPLKDNLPE